MPKKTTAEDVKDILVANRAAALSYANSVGTGRVHEMLAFAEADLLERLKGARGGTFTEAHLKSTLMQVRLVTSQLVDQLSFAFHEEADVMGDMAGQSTIDYMMAADAAFRGVGVTPLALREASVLDSAKMGSKASLLRFTAEEGKGKKQQGVLERYGLNTIGEFEKILRNGVVTRKSVDDVSKDLTKASTFLQGKPASWAERIARTELMGAYNRASWESHREIDEQLGGDMVKILSATFDDRTAADSYAVHGQIRRPEEAFETWYGLMQHPPARPNDREVVVPHRISWEIPRYLKPRTPAEVKARWVREGHKDEMPPIPEYSTVPLDQFGKEPEKKEDEGDDKNRSLVDEVMGKKDLQDQVGDDLLQENYGPAPVTPEPEPTPEPSAKEQADKILQGLPEGRNANVVKHGLAHVDGKPFWQGWSEAEQDLISKLIDDDIEKDKTEDVHPLDVIHQGTDMNKVGLGYGLEDTIAGDAMTPSLIKKDGLLYAYAGNSPAAAAALLGKEKMKATVLDLDDPEVKAKFDAVKPKVTPDAPKPIDPENILATKTAGKAGSNEGGFYKGKDGKERYVKVYKDPAQAHCEAISNAIYKKLGLSAPDSVTFEHEGKTYYAHETVEGKTLDKVGVDKKTATKILDGFAADILLGNRDVIGLSKDNILVTKDGVRRIDNGGSLLFRANAGKKSFADMQELKEWDGFFNSNLNTYASVLDAAGVKTHADMKKQLVSGIKNIKKLRDDAGGWERFINEAAPAMADSDRRDVISMLDKRTKLLEEKLKILNKRKPKEPKPIKLEPGAWGPKDTTTYEDLLTRTRGADARPKDSPGLTPNGKDVGYKDKPGTYKGDGHKTLLDHTTATQRSSISDFTGSSYTSIRKAGRMTREEYKKANYGYDSDYERYKEHADNIEAAFDAIPEEKRIEGTVFRGMKIPRSVANAMLAQNDKPHLPGLGSMFSTSRRVGPAEGFLTNGDGDTHVMMVIKQKRGVAIETISEHSSEDEVLMSGKTKCRLVDHYVVDSMSNGYVKNVLVLHLEEVE